MPQQDPGWFYIGNGQLQYKDSDGWTDQYQDLDGPVRGSDPVPPPSAEDPEPAKAKAVRVRKHHLWRFVRHCAATTYRSIATRYREASAGSAKKAIESRPRHRGNSSRSSVVRSQIRHASVVRSEIRDASLARQLRERREEKEADDARPSRDDRI